MKENLAVVVSDWLVTGQSAFGRETRTAQRNVVVVPLMTTERPALALNQHVGANDAVRTKSPKTIGSPTKPPTQLIEIPQTE